MNPNVSIDAGCGVKLPRVHYVDEGPRGGRVILCLHGEPSWSFLYRKMVPILTEAGYRVIVPDFIGFGKSDKYTNPDNYNHEMHCMTLRKLLDHLDVKDITLVCQDWGGLTGLSVVKDAPDRFSNLVIMNTGLPSPILDLSDDMGGEKSVSISKKIQGVCILLITTCSLKYFNLNNFSFYHSFFGDVVSCSLEQIYPSIGSLEECSNVME